MKLSYLAHIIRNKQKAIAKITVPDLNLIIPKEKFASLTVDSKKDIKQIKEIVRQEILNALQQTEVTALKSSVLEEHAGEPHQLLDVEVEHNVENPKEPCLAQALPISGILTTSLYIVGNFIIALAALDAASSATEDRNASRVLAFMISLIQAFLAFVIYLYSPATATLKKLGKNIHDKLFSPAKEKSEETTEAQNQSKTSCCTSTKIIALRLGLGGILLGSMAASTVTLKQELDALSAQVPTTYIPLPLFLGAEYAVLAGNNAYALTFIGSYIKLLADAIESKCCARKPEDDSANETRMSRSRSH